jgi:DNA-binding IclR family transcriptional regulator
MQQLQSPEDKILKVADIAKDLGICRNSVHALMNMTGDPLPCYRLSTKLIRVSNNQYQEWKIRRNIH